MFWNYIAITKKTFTQITAVLTKVFLSHQTKTNIRSEISVANKSSDIHLEKWIIQRLNDSKKYKFLQSIVAKTWEDFRLPLGGIAESVIGCIFSAKPQNDARLPSGPSTLTGASCWVFNGHCCNCERGCVVITSPQGFLTVGGVCRCEINCSEQVN